MLMLEARDVCGGATGRNGKCRDEISRIMPAREKSNERRADMIPPRQVASSGHMPTLGTQAGPAGLALMGH